MNIDWKACTLCPRECRADRTRALGLCKASDKIMAARAALHMWEEPCISGDEGSGAVFFSGCSLGCVYCQNSDIAKGNSGKEIQQTGLLRYILSFRKKKLTT